MREETSARGGILLVTLSDGDVERVVQISGGLAIAGYNSPSSVLLSGDVEAIRRAEDRFREHSIESHRVKVDVASHSPAMDPILDTLRQELRSLAPQLAQTPIRSTVRDTWLKGPECGPDHWAENLRRPVRFYQAIEALAGEGASVFVELSPHPILLESIKQTLSKKKAEFWALASCWRDADERSSLLRTLAALYELGFDVDWSTVNGKASSRPLQRVRLGDIDESFHLAAPRSTEQRESLPLLLSAKSAEALKGQAERLREHVLAHQDLTLVDLAYSLATTRTRFEHRAAIVADSHDGLLSALDALAQGRPAPGTTLGHARGEGKAAFLFTGQGSQRPATGRALYEAFPIFREALEPSAPISENSISRCVR